MQHRNVEVPSAFRANLPRWRQIEAAGVQWRTFKGLFVHSWKVPAERRKLFWLCWARRWHQACSFPGLMGKDSLEHGMRATEFWPADAIMPGGQSCRRGGSAVFWEWSLELQVALLCCFFLPKAILLWWLQSVLNMVLTAPMTSVWERGHTITMVTWMQTEKVTDWVWICYLSSMFKLFLCYQCHTSQYSQGVSHWYWFWNDAVDGNLEEHLCEEVFWLFLKLLNQNNKESRREPTKN